MSLPVDLLTDGVVGRPTLAAKPKASKNGGHTLGVEEYLTEVPKFARTWHGIDEGKYKTPSVGMPLWLKGASDADMNLAMRFKERRYIQPTTS